MFNKVMNLPIFFSIVESTWLHRHFVIYISEMLKVTQEIHTFISFLTNTALPIIVQGLHRKPTQIFSFFENKISLFRYFPNKKNGVVFYVDAQTPPLIYLG